MAIVERLPTTSETQLLQDCFVGREAPNRRSIAVYAMVSRSSDCGNDLKASAERRFNAQYALAQMLRFAVEDPSVAALLPRCQLPSAFAEPYSQGVREVLDHHPDAFKVLLSSFRRETEYVPDHPERASSEPFDSIFLGLTSAADGDLQSARRHMKQALERAEPSKLNLAYFFSAQIEFARGERQSARESLARAIAEYVAYTQFPAMPAPAAAAAYMLQFLR